MRTRTRDELGERVKNICKLYHDGKSLEDIAVEIYQCEPGTNLCYIRITTVHTLILRNYEKIYGTRPV